MRKAILIAFLVFAVVLVSCKYEHPINYSIVQDTLSLSFIRDEGSSRSIPSGYKMEVGAGIEYKTAIEESNLVCRLTPDVFYMAMNNIALYNPIDNADVTSGVYCTEEEQEQNANANVSYDGGFTYKHSKDVCRVLEANAVAPLGSQISGYIPNRINMLYTKGLSASFHGDGKRQWNGVYFDLFQGDEWNIVNDMYSGSYVGIRKSVFEEKGIALSDIANKLSSLPPSVDRFDDYV